MITNKKLLLIISTLLFVSSVFSQGLDKYSLPGGEDGNITVRGNMTFAANAIVNRTFLFSHNDQLSNSNFHNVGFYKKVGATNQKEKIGKYQKLDLYDFKDFERVTEVKTYEEALNYNSSKATLYYRTGPHWMGNGLEYRYTKVSEMYKKKFYIRKPNGRYVEYRPGANTPYNGESLYLYNYWWGAWYIMSHENVSNGHYLMDYIDVDDDPSTFSSSKSTLSTPDCAEIVYAGLYWAAVYPYGNWERKNFAVSDSGESLTSNRKDDNVGDYKKMLFKLPGESTYQTIESEVVLKKPNESGTNKGRATYVCYTNITDKLKALKGKHNGEYTAANIYATLGLDDKQGLGSGGGWVMTVIYKDDKKDDVTTKHFSVFHGFKSISQNAEEVITFDGFKTINDGPVKVSLITAALEGDYALDGDSYEVYNKKRAENSNITDPKLKNAPYDIINNSNNFFRGTINSSGRVPNSRINLGLDARFMELPNTNNENVRNGDTSASFRFRTNSDVFWPFLNAFSVEVIEPDIKMVKTILDANQRELIEIPNHPEGALQDANGNEVVKFGLGGTLWYKITYKNRGNDDVAGDAILTDELPKNVTLENVVLPEGITYTYTEPTKTSENGGVVKIKIPEENLKQGMGGVIQLKIKLTEDCTRFADYCSNRIQNKAIVTYKGEINTKQKTDESTTISEDCTIRKGTTDFFIDLNKIKDDCDLKSKKEVVCNGKVTLKAGNDFDAYNWFKFNTTTSNYEPLKDCSGNPKSTTQSIDITVCAGGTVSDIVGKYMVKKDKKANDTRCINLTEYFDIESEDSIVNPLLKQADETASCKNTAGADVMSFFYLCGNNDKKSIKLGISEGSTNTVKWEKLTTPVTNDTNQNCPKTEAGGYTWANINSGKPQQTENKEYEKTFEDAGYYRVTIWYGVNRCPKTYYFIVTKSTLEDIEYKVTRTCDGKGTLKGNVNITKVSVGYKYSLVKHNASGNKPENPAESTYTENKKFLNKDIGDYTLFIKSTDSKYNCVYDYPVTISNLDLSFTIKENANRKCYEEKGNVTNITVTMNESFILEKNAKINYKITDAGGNVKSVSTTDKEYTFENIKVNGKYTVEVSTTMASGCKEVQTRNLQMPTQVTLTASKGKDIDCTDGRIDLVATGGTFSTATPHEFAIYAYQYKNTDGTYGNTVTNTSFDFKTPQAPGTSTTTKYSFDINKPGRYWFTARDNNHCPKNSLIKGPIEIVSKKLNFNYEIVNSCDKNATNGSIVVTLADGSSFSGTIEHSLKSDFTSPKNTSGIFNDLSPNTNYIVYTRTKNADGICTYKSNPLEICESPDIKSTATFTATTNDDCSSTHVVTFTPATGGSLKIDPKKLRCDPNGETPYPSSLITGSDTGYNKQLLIFDWQKEDGTLQKLSKKNRVVTSKKNYNGITYEAKITFVETTDDSIEFGAHVLETWTATRTYLFHNYADYGKVKEKDLKGALFVGKYNDQKFKFKIEVTAKDACGKLQKIDVIPFDAESTDKAEYLKYTTNAGEFKKLTYFGPQDPTSEDFRGLGTKTIWYGKEDKETVRAASALAYTTGYNVSIDGEVGLDGGGSAIGVGIWMYCRQYKYNIINVKNNTQVNQATASGLTHTITAPGTYRFEVEDSSGCSITLPNELIVPELPQKPTISYALDYDCTGKQATVTILAKTSTPTTYSYTYTLTDGNTFSKTNQTGIFSSVPTNNYTVTVNYGNNCTILTSKEVVVRSGIAFTPTYQTSTPPTCGNSNGSVTINVGNFSPTYSYSVDGGVSIQTNTTTLIVKDLSSGTHTVTFKYKTCEIPVSFTLTETVSNLKVEPTATIIGCSGSGATINANPSGGTLSYTTIEARKQTIPASTWSTTLSGITATGTYEVRVTDSDGCIASNTVDINGSNNIVFTANATNCFDGSNGTVSVSVTQGGGDYKVNLSGEKLNKTVSGNAGQTTFNIGTGAISGTFSITVTDKYSCSLTKTVTINSKLGISLDSNSKASSCKKGSLSFSANGGDGNYVYAILPSSATVSTSTVFTSTGSTQSLTKGEYKAYVRDNGGVSPYCEASSNAINLGFVKTPTVSIEVVKPYCLGDKGAIKVTSVKEGVAPYKLQLYKDGVATGTAVNIAAGGTHTFTGLESGTFSYTVSIIDSTTCSSTSRAVSITPALALDGTVTLTSDTRCDTGSVATVTFTAPTIGSGSYKYLLQGTKPDNTRSNTTTVFKHMKPDTYTVTIKDIIRNCTQSLGKITVSDPTENEPTFNQTVTYSCNGNARIKLTPNSSGTYTYTISEGNTSTNTGVFDVNGSDVTKTYNFDITYDTGCTTSATVSVVGNKKFAPTLSTTNNVKCNGDNNGSVTISIPNAGTLSPTNYEYAINGSGWIESNTTSLILGGLSKGTATITLRYKGELDTNYCEFTFTPTIEETDAITFTPTVKKIDCNNNGATIEIVGLKNPKGGTKPYKAFEIKAPNSSNWDTNLTGLTVTGTYIVRVTDYKDCTATKTVEVLPYQAIDFTLSATQCFDGSNGRVTVSNITEGANISPTNYEYAINGSSVFKDITSVPFDITENILASTYTITIKNAITGCSTSKAITINKELSVTSEITSATSCGKGSITVTGTEGSGSGYQYDINNSGTFTTTNTFTLAEGIHTVTVRDRNGGAGHCVTSTIVTIGKTTTPTVVVIPTSVVTPTCSGNNDGAFDVQVTGGTASYTITVEGASYSSTVIKPTTGKSRYDRMIGGIYTITLTDGSSCIATTTINLQAPDQIKGATATKTADVTCNVGGTISFTTPTGGTSPYRYLVSGGGLNQTRTSTSGLVENLPAGTYSITVKDKNNCSINLPNIIINDIPVLPSFTTTITYNCDGKGVVTVTPTTSTALSGFMYSVDGGTTTSSNIFTLPSKGSQYEFTISLARACSVTTSAIVEPNQEFKVDIVDKNNPICNNDNDGSITIAVSNFYKEKGFTYTDASGSIQTITVGTGNYGDTVTKTITGFSSGIASTTVSTINAGSCSATIVSTTLENPTVVTITSYAIVKSVTCDTDPTKDGATVKIVAVGGTKKITTPTPKVVYEYKLLNAVTGSIIKDWQPSDEFTDLDAGSYSATVRDSYGCTSSPTQITIAPKANLVVDVQKETCFTAEANNAKITVKVTGGNGGEYKFNLKGSGYAGSTVWHSVTGNTTTPSAITPTTYVFDTGLDTFPTTYTITVLEVATGCIDTKTSSINKELKATVSKEDVTDCKDGRITITNLEGGVGNYVYGIKEKGSAVSPTFALANATTSETITFVAGVTSKTYEVYIRDNNGNADYCEYKKEITVNRIAKPDISTVSALEPVVCYGTDGTVKVEFNGGAASYSLTIDSGTYSETRTGLSGSSVTTTVSFNNLPVGTGVASTTYTTTIYTITLTDNYGCIATKTVEITRLPNLSLTKVGNVLPTSCVAYETVPNEFGYKYEFPAGLTLPTGYKLQVWREGSTEPSYPDAWIDVTGTQTTTITSVKPETTVSPKVRFVQTTLPNIAFCTENLPKYKTAYDIESIVVGATYSLSVCQDGLTVNIRVTGSSDEYGYAINNVGKTILNPSPPNNYLIGTPTGWESQDSITPAVGGIRTSTKQFKGLVPGREYRFYIFDTTTGCIKMHKDTIILDDAIKGIPEITPIISTGMCATSGGTTSATLAFTIDTKDVTFSPTDTWSLYKLNGTTLTGTLTASGTLGVALPAGTTTTLTAAETVVGEGKYYLQITKGGSKSCTYASKDKEVVAPNPVTASLTVVNNITCSTPGVINITNVGGGYGNYQYLTSNLSYTHSGTIYSNTSATVSGTTITIPHSSFTGGVDRTKSVTVNFTVVDKNGCEATTSTTLTISDSPEVTFSDTTCTTRSITLNVENGTAPYKYSIDNGVAVEFGTSSTHSATYTIPESEILANNFGAKNYTILVKDVNGCESAPKVTTVYPKPAFTVLQSSDDINCTNSGDVVTVTIDITAGVFTETYTYEYTYDESNPTNINTGTFSITASAKSVKLPLNISSGGNYTITVTDIRGCQYTQTFKIKDKKQFIAKAESTSISVCDGNTGTITVVSGTGNEIEFKEYTISSTTATFTPGYTFTNTTGIFGSLASGTYTVTILGGNGCTTTVSSTINELSPILPTIAVTQFVCGTDSRTVKKATISLIGSTGGVVSGTSTDIRNIFFIDTKSSTNVSDHVRLNPKGGTVTSTEVTKAGKYYILVEDTNGCIGSSTIVEVEEYKELKSGAATVLTDLTCTTSATVRFEFVANPLGSITATNFDIVAGNGGSYSLTSLSGTQSSATYALSAGTYTVTITNPATGCSIEVPYTVDQMPTYELIATQKSKACSNTDTSGSASISFKPVEGNTYTGTFDYEVHSGNTLVVSGSSTETVTITDLAAGNYTVTATMTGTPYCTTASATFTIELPTSTLSLSHSVVTPTCNGNSDGSIKLTATGGYDVSYEYKLFSSTVTDYSGKGYTSTGFSLFKDLSAGAYIGYVKDYNGCTTTVTVNVQDWTTVSGTLSVDANSCNDANAQITVSNLHGGTGSNYKITVINVNDGTSQDYSYTASSTVIPLITPTGTTESITYKVVVSDGNTCSVTLRDDITIYRKLTASVVQTDNVTCNGTNGEVSVTVVPGSGATYTLEAEFMDASNTASTTLIILPTGTTTSTFNVYQMGSTYTVTVTDNGAEPNNCGKVFTGTVNTKEDVEPSFTVTKSSDDNCDESIVTLKMNDSSSLTYSITLTSGSAASATITKVNAKTYTIASAATGDGMSNTYAIVGTDPITGCTFTKTETITILPKISLNSSTLAVSQFGCTVPDLENANKASISFSVSNITGGTGSYEKAQLYKVASPKDLRVGSPITIKGSTATFTFEISDYNGGDYYVKFIDSSGCSGKTTTNVTIAAYYPLKEPKITPVSSTTCSTGERIHITHNPSTISASDILYSIDGINFTSTNEFDLTAGTTYTVTVRNSVTGCDFNKTYAAQSAPIIDINITYADAVCYSSTTGSVTLGNLITYKYNPIAESDNASVYGGVFTYTGTYTATVHKKLDDSQIGTYVSGNTNGSRVISNSLPAGKYYVKVNLTGSPYCEVTKDFTIAQPAEALGLTVTRTNVVCNNQSNGSLTVSGKGGWGSGIIGYPYKFKVEQLLSGSTYTTTQDFAVESVIESLSLSKGTYRVTVQDEKGCATASQTVDITNPTTVSATLNIDENACDDSEQAKAIITVTASGGTYTGTKGTGYEYTLYNESGIEQSSSNGYVTGNTYSFTVSTDSKSTYKIKVKDGNGCESGFIGGSITINKLDYALVETKPVTCKLDGEVSLTVVSGSGATYTYEVRDESTGAVTTSGTIPAGQTTATFVVSEAGNTYSVVLTDTGVIPVCGLEKSILIEDKVYPIIDVVSTVENCSKVEVTFGSGLIYSATLSSGTASATVTINNNVLEVISTDTSNKLENKYIISGTNSATGCTSTKSINITIPKAVTISSTLTQKVDFGCNTNELKNSARIEIPINAISGGTGVYVKAQLEKSGSSIVKDVIVNSEGTAFVFIITDKNGGDYEVSVFDSKGCLSNKIPVTIKKYVEFSVDKPVVNIRSTFNCKTPEVIQVTTGGTVTNVTIAVTEESTGNTVTPTTANGNTFSLTTAGRYNVVVTDIATGCSIETVHTVKELSEYRVNALVANNTCLNSDKGAITFEFSSVTPYSGSYTYKVFTKGSNPNTATPVLTSTVGQSFSGTTTTTGSLAKGEYYVYVTMTDMPYCPFKSNPVSIKESDVPLSIEVEKLGLISCSDANAGSIRVIGKGGWGGYQYKFEQLLPTPRLIKDFTSNLNRSIDNLSAGTYLVTVKDKGGCEDVKQIVLTNPSVTNPITITNLSKTNVLCSGNQTASLNVSVIGGQGSPTVNYTYTLVHLDKDNFEQKQNSSMFNGLVSGNYKVIVSDDYNCSTETITTITEPEKLVANYNILSDVNCVNPKASVRIIGQRGAGGYEFSNDGISYGSNNEFELSPRNEAYKFYVKDANNCKAQVAVIIKPVTYITVELDTTKANITCNNSDNAKLSVKAKGGIGKYQYELLEGSTGTNVIKGPQDEDYFDGLSEGTYRIRVTTEGGCSAITNPHSISNVSRLELTAIGYDVSCPGEATGRIRVSAKGGNGDYVFNISSDSSDKYMDIEEFTELEAGTYTITVRDKLGCPSVPPSYKRVVISEPERLEVLKSDFVITQQKCITDPTPTLQINKIIGGTAPYILIINGVRQEYKVGDIVPLKSGELYNIVVTDQNECDLNVEFNEEVPAPIDLGIDVAPVTYDCDGFASVKVNNPYNSGVTYKLIAIDTDGNADYFGVENAKGEFINIPKGEEYVIRVEHNNGCSFDSSPFEVANIDETLKFTVDKSEKNKFIVNAIGGLPDYEYSFDGGKTFTSDNTYKILETREYNIVVRDARTTDELEGCPTSKIVKGNYVSINIPNIFTPDGDGTNDYWYPRKVEPYHNIKVVIFDRYAREIVLYEGVKAADEGWDGRYKGKPLPSGDYWYTIHYNELSGEEKKIMGHFTLYRK